MIRYRVSLRALCRRIDKENPDWRGDAAARTAMIIAKGRYDEPSSIWSKVKGVYIRLQHAKCAYCERRLVGEELGKTEWDVEHFRPKGRVALWSPPASSAGFAYAPVPAGVTGYHRLAYNPMNYCVACKTCNSRLKADCFPVAIDHRFDLVRIPSLNVAERPYLIYPIGEIDADPEALIGFFGHIAFARPTPAQDRARAQVVIDFFQLNEDARSELRDQRCFLIDQLFNNLEIVRTRSGIARRIEKARKMVEVLLRDSTPHANCARCFKALYDSDRTQAARFHGMAVKTLHRPRRRP